jgi:hypothetical protein
MAVKDENKNGVPDYLEKPSSTAGFNPAGFNPRTPAIQLPGIPGGVAATEAYGWFRLVAAKAPKGTPARGYYDDFVRNLTALGIPKSKWNSVWKDAVDWTQTPGSGSNGRPSGYLASLDPSDYATAGSGKKYGTTKADQTTVTEYSTSAAATDITAGFKSELGREAGANEILAYQKAVNQAAKKEPSVYTSTTTTAPGAGGVMSTSKTGGVSKTGFDPTRFAIEYARSNPDYAENFAVKNFLKLVDQALSDPNRVGLVVE